MGKPSIKVRSSDIRRMERQASHRIAKREIPYVSIAQDAGGKILAVGIHHEAVAKELGRMGVEAEVMSFEVHI